MGLAVQERFVDFPSATQAAVIEETGAGRRTSGTTGATDTTGTTAGTTTGWTTGGGMTTTTGATTTGAGLLTVLQTVFEGKAAISFEVIVAVLQICAPSGAFDWTVTEKLSRARMPGVKVSSTQ